MSEGARAGLGLAKPPQGAPSRSTNKTPRGKTRVHGPVDGLLTSTPAPPHLAGLGSDRHRLSVSGASLTTSRVDVEGGGDRVPTHFGRRAKLRAQPPEHETPQSPGGRTGGRTRTRRGKRRSGLPRGRSARTAGVIGRLAERKASPHPRAREGQVPGVRNAATTFMNERRCGPGGGAQG